MYHFFYLFRGVKRHMETNHNHWVVINGSPRRGMNSDRLIEALFQTKAFKNSEKTLYKLSNLNVSPCSGCTLCLDTKRCVKNDDFHLITNAIKTHKRLILISPSYHYNVTSQMKTFIDRLFSQHAFAPEGHHSRLGSGVKAILLGVCAGDTDGMGYTIDAMKRPLQDLGIDILKTYTYVGTKHLPVSTNQNLISDLDRVFGVGM